MAVSAPGAAAARMMSFVLSEIHVTPPVRLHVRVYSSPFVPTFVTVNTAVSVELNDRAIVVSPGVTDTAQAWHPPWHGGGGPCAAARFETLTPRKATRIAATSSTRRATTTDSGREVALY
jgi:hypothetical protein